MHSERFERDFKSELYLLRPIIAEAMDFIHSNFDSLSPQNEYDLRLIISELIYNAVLHGNKCDAKKKVHLCIVIHDCEVSVTVKDDGSGFDYASIINDSPENESSLYNEHGRGIKFVSVLTDSLYYSPPGNQINVRKTLFPAERV